jgi:hypothetical protein
MKSLINCSNCHVKEAGPCEVPLALFDLTNREQFLKACHYTNLQPMWAKDNISKGKKTNGYLNSVLE